MGGVCDRERQRECVCVCQSLRAQGSEAVRQAKPRSAVCSQSVLSSVKAAAQLSCILSWAGPGEGWGDGATALIRNHFKQMRSLTSNTILILISYRKLCSVRNRQFAFKLEDFFCFLWLQTPGEVQTVFQDVNGESQISSIAVQLNLF